MTTETKKIRVRFAPSPTGFMHVGNFRTALYTYLFAKKNQGDFILRIEDTDKKRQIENGIEGIIKILQWADFKYQEGVLLEDGKIIQKGDFGPYIQSERLEIYRKYAEELVANGTAYYCFCSSERLEELREEQTRNKKAPMYDRKCLNLSQKEIQAKIDAGEKYVIRQKINTEGVTRYDDVVRGTIEFRNELLEDQILMKSDGYPTYNFANVIDDHLMEISHVFRGEEFVSSTPKYIQLYQNFGWESPRFAHLPLLLNPDKTKLSKRQGDVAVEDYIKNGYLRETIINFVALLGWNPGAGETQEIFSFAELVEKFDLKKVHKAGAVFDLKKLDWINAEYIKKLSADELYKKALPFFEKKEFYQNTSAEKKSPEFLKRVLEIEKDRLVKLLDVGENNQFFFANDLVYDKTLLRWKDMSDEELQKTLEKSKTVLENISEADWTRENLEKVLIETAGDKKGELLWPLRASLTGVQKSPSPFDVAWVLGKTESLKRIVKAIELSS